MRQTELRWANNEQKQELPELGWEDDAEDSGDDLPQEGHSPKEQEDLNPGVQNDDAIVVVISVVVTRVEGVQEADYEENIIEHFHGGSDVEPA